MSILSQYTDEEFSKIVNDSHSYREVIQKLGYNCHSGDLYNIIKNRISALNLSTEHFSILGNGKIERTPNNIFIENSTASQKVLREHYKKGNYTPYICSICGQKPIWQGKELTLILDHINGKNHDDRLENLRWVCPNCNQQLDTNCGKNIRNKTPKKFCLDCGKEITKNSIRCKSCAAKLNSQRLIEMNRMNRHKKINKKYYCIDCGTEISRQSTRCNKCASKWSHLDRKKFEITREELKILIRELPFTNIAKQFNVSDNAIRKRCKSFNLPYKTSEIKSYSDEEWKKI